MHAMAPVGVAERATRLGVPEASRAFSRVAVLGTLEAAVAEWHALQQVAAISPYQTYDLLQAWTSTEGAAAGITPMLVLAYDGQDQPVALLPLGRRCIGRLSVAEFLGGKQANYNLGLFRPGVAWSPAALQNLLRRAARDVVGGLDLFAFGNQPVEWNGIPNPLHLLGGQPSPSFAHRAELTADADAFLAAHQSSHARKVLRSKRRKLETMGAVTMLRASSEAEMGSVLAAYVEQKAAKLAAMGVSERPDSPAALAFLRNAARTGPLELHALRCDQRIVATFAGAGHDGRFSGLLISYDQSDDVARTSPGEILLTELIRQKCLAGYGSFDLGIGEARYKESYCPLPEPLFDTFVPVTLTGRAVMAFGAARLRLKRAIKQSDRAWRLAQRLRRWRGGLMARLG